MQHIPREMVDALCERGTNLIPRMLIPAFIRNQHAALNECIRYLEFAGHIPISLVFPSLYTLAYKYTL